jgi:23S rRNA pseudouridine2605 synthase
MTETSKEGERIAKRLSRAGVASRRDAEEMIVAGRVRVNGKPITSPALNVRESDVVEVDGRVLAAPEAARLWLYHKPVGLVTTAKDEKGRETVFDNLPAGMPRVMSIGRLDLTSEGLLLLTNDGEIKRRLELPSTGWQRRYRVRVNGSPDDARLEPLRKGIVIEGERFQAMEVKIDRQQGANAWLTVGIREGRNREIRRAMEHVGLKVNRLIRVSYGPFQLGELAAGAVEEIKSRVLRDQLGLTSPGVVEEQAKPKRTPRPERKPASTGEVKRSFKPSGKPKTDPAKTDARPARTTSARPAVAKPRKGPPKDRKV